MCYIFTHDVDVNENDAIQMKKVDTVDFSNKTGKDSINIGGITEKKNGEDISIESILIKLNGALKNKSVEPDGED